MGIVIASWCWIGISALLTGSLFIYVLEKATQQEAGKEIDISVASGLCVLTVYAQIFSLFGGVGKGATLLLLCVDFISIWILRKKFSKNNGLKFWCRMSKPMIKYIVIACFIIVFMSILTSAKAESYDTDLYHAQAIRWIEEFGIVPGLGNLHNRLAYNSSFLPLQALFSLKWLGGGRSVLYIR